MTVSPQSPYTPVVCVVAEILTEHGPLTEHHLVTKLQDRGIDLGDHPEETLWGALDEVPAPLAVLADERWAWLPALFAGHIFTHRLTEAEVTHDVLFMTPDLTPLESLLQDESFQRLSDGAAIASLLLPFDTDVLVERLVPAEDFADDTLLLLPAGYLSGRELQAGDLIALSVTSEGLDLDAVDAPDPSPSVLAELARAITDVLDVAQPVELDVAIWSACAARPELLHRPLPPLEEALTSCGVSRDVEWVAHEGFDFHRWRASIRTSALARRYGLTRDEALTVVAAIAVYDEVSQLYAAAQAVADAPGALDDVLDRLHTPAPDEAPLTQRATVKDALTMLDRPMVVAAVLAEAMGAEDADPAGLGLFAETLEPQVPRRARAGLRWLRAKAYERLGRIEMAEQTLLAAESLDPDWPLTLFDLARYACDRGDAERGLSLLRRAGVPADDTFTRVLEHYRGTSRSDLGRNETCWCGSGRKYKKCHINDERLPLEERAAWLYDKACLFLMNGPWREQHSEIVDLRATYADSYGAALAAATDPLVFSASCSRAAPSRTSSPPEASFCPQTSASSRSSGFSSTARCSMSPTSAPAKGSPSAICAPAMSMW